MTFQASVRPGIAALRTEEAVLVCRIARERGGLAIDPGKRSFLEQRLARRMRLTGHTHFSHYIADLLRPGAEAEVQAMIEALTTHTTGFFREPAQFDWLRETGLPDRIAAGAGREWPLAVWSAACSTGAELWTAAIVMDRLALASPRALRWQVIGSDLSVSILRHAAEAIYAETDIAGMPEDLRRGYLLRSRQRRSSGHLYRITPDLRGKARFFRVNLVEGPLPPDLAADVALLRNVLIYFDEAGRAAAVRNVLSRLRSGGFLLTGHTESLNPVPAGLTQVGPSIYRKP